MFSLPLSVWPGGRWSTEGLLPITLLATKDTYGTQADLFALLYAGKTTVRFHLLGA
jgi:hypothetical protein